MKTDLDVYETIHNKTLKLGDKVSVTESCIHYTEYSGRVHKVVGLYLEAEHNDSTDVEIVLYDGDTYYDGLSVFDIEPAEDKED